MKKVGLFVFLFLFFFLLFCRLPIKAQTRDEVICDLCGYCPSANPTPPSNWRDCVGCLYPNASLDPASRDTLKVDRATKIPPTPYPGRHYTLLGCVQTKNVGFSTERGAVGVGQFFLNIIFSIIGGLAFIFLIYGSYIIITSQNSPERLDYGKRVIYGAIVGVIFSLSSVLIVRFIAGGILRIPGFGF